MPIQEGSSQEVIDFNIRELTKAGYKRNQAVAIALKKANKARKAESQIEKTE